MKNLNAEQQWLASKIKEWPKGVLAVTRGPFDSLIYVYPRECTSEYCINHRQFISAKKGPAKPELSHSLSPSHPDLTSGSE